MTRRRLLALLGGGLLTGGAWRALQIDKPTPVAEVPLSPRARQLVAWAWDGIDPAKVVDVHVHVVGLGRGDTGCFVHPDATSLLSPLRYAKTHVYMSAAGIYDDARADRVFVERLLDLCGSQQPRGRFLLLAFDQHRTADGQPDLERTEFYTPNDYVLGLARDHPDLFLAACSVHPYRDDALDELTRCREAGAVAVKWLPNAMGIDPLDPRCDPFYERLRALNLTLISHAGEEQAVHAEEAQELGNPLRLRRPLDHGVKVVVAHCASLGTSRDLDAPESAGERPRVSSYALFRRLAAEERHRGRLFGGISAMTQFNRCETPLAETIASPELHPLLVNGSDYPLPAIDPLIQTRLLVSLGYLTEAERAACNEVFAANPLLFDFVVKRCLKVKRDGTVHRLPASAFETAHLFAPA